MERQGELSKGRCRKRWRQEWRGIPVGPGGSAAVSLGKGEVFQQIVWDFTVCAGCCRSKDQDALDFKEGIHFRGLPQPIALLGS